MPPELNDGPAGDGPEFWQSIDQWMDEPKFREMMRDEFPDDAAEWLDPVSRRQFLQLSAASLALAGVAGCNPSLKPASQRKVVPYVQQPTDILPGVPLFFATAMAGAGGVGLGLLVKSTEGRPIKVEGNPQHPSSLGGTNLFAQATVLDVYDPERSKEVAQRGVGTSYEKVLSDVKRELDKLKPGKGAAVRILSGPTTSQTLVRLINEFLSAERFPDARWVQYEPMGDANGAIGAFQAFGRRVNPVYDFKKANVVLSLDSDFLSADGPGGPRYARDFAGRRKVRDLGAGRKAGDGVAPTAAAMNRLYAVESMLTPTGGTADHRLPLKPSEIELFARALAAKLGVAGVAAGELPAGAAAWIDPLAADLQANNGKAIVMVGPEQPAAVHQIGWAINLALGAVGATVTLTDPLDGLPADREPKGAAALAELVGEMKAGKVELLFILGGNPVYDAPADLEFAAALNQVRVKLHLGSHVDETGVLATYHVNAAHFLECWGDVRGHDGTITIQQPLIAPIFGGRSAIELFAGILDQVGIDSYETVKATHAKRFPDPVAWDKAVKNGVVPESALPAVTVNAPRAAEGLGTAPAKSTGLEIQFKPDPTLYDGRYATNGWLQELPKAVTNLTWDNAAIVSPKTAKELGVYADGFTANFKGDNLGTEYAWTGGERGRAECPMIELTVGDRTIKAAVWVLPSHADGAVTLHAGHGRERAGRVGSKTGFNAYKLRTTANLWHAAGVGVKKTGETYYLACTQGHYAMEGRRPYRTATVAQFRADHDFAQVPAASAAEYKEIRALTPGTQEDWERLYGKDGPKFPHAHSHHDHDHDHEGHDHAHDHGEEHHGDHDKRIIPLSLYPDYPNKVNGEEASKSYRRWGLAIDLGACTGCTACVVACVSENNIAVVGKDQVTRGRSMHWLRIDRYFSIPGEAVHSDQLGDRHVRGKERAEKILDAAAIKAHFQPNLCQQCEKAPCEVVCPVNATVHSADGLNDMVYNRCVGTRYCSNNCPYKVRRFNFLQYADYNTESLKLVNNPEVTVRTRGVMEKCTYCVQRIRNAEMEAEREFDRRPKDANGRPKIMDGEIVTACQQACPTGAIQFGDLNDRESTVLRWKAEPTNYGLLAEQNTMPRTSYLAAIKNPNPAMPKGA